MTVDAWPATIDRMNAWLTREITCPVDYRAIVAQRERDDAAFLETLSELARAVVRVLSLPARVAEALAPPVPVTLDD